MLEKLSLETGTLVRACEIHDLAVSLLKLFSLFAYLVSVYLLLHS